MPFPGRAPEVLQRFGVASGTQEAPREQQAQPQRKVRPLADIFVVPELPYLGLAALVSRGRVGCDEALEFVHGQHPLRDVGEVRPGAARQHPLGGLGEVTSREREHPALTFHAAAGTARHHSLAHPVLRVRSPTRGLGEVELRRGGVSPTQRQLAHHPRRQRGLLPLREALGQVEAARAPRSRRKSVRPREVLHRRERLQHGGDSAFRHILGPVRLLSARPDEGGHEPLRHRVLQRGLESGGIARDGPGDQQQRRHRVATAMRRLLRVQPDGARVVSRAQQPACLLSEAGDGEPQRVVEALARELPRELEALLRVLLEAHARVSPQHERGEGGVVATLGGRQREHLQESGAGGHRVSAGEGASPRFVQACLPRPSARARVDGLVLVLQHPERLHGLGDQPRGFEGEGAIRQLSQRAGAVDEESVGKVRTARVGVAHGCQQHEDEQGGQQTTEPQVTPRFPARSR
ncbi:hypothetical protein [Myxococcus qinghaiensis]|uniref:hypothetical protein n=1 Tax=Myxococcus qinghaiensis TaxID=2906758 RepID=UPI0020A7A247|nr:hypothetical protein [Myxococcus qinghaiensis]MCP3162489.1 hypothetical protein [Myxococcus qinghaiensis]